MEKMIRFNTISEYNTEHQHTTLHPLITVIDFSKASPRELTKAYFGFYLILLKEVKCGDIRYGKNTYDYQEGTLIFVAPGQVVEPAAVEGLYQPTGKAVAFHPDLILGTSLGRHIHDYTFFEYSIHEALHMSERERQIILDYFSKIAYELKLGVDKHSKKLITSNIEVLLNYCDRFYDRQFITRDNVNKGIVDKYETLLNGYFNSDKPQRLGLPSVAYFADELNLSANYFGDLIKKETGKSAQEHIQLKLISIAKNRILDPEQSVSEIAYELGFKYPQHFNRMFKKATGQTPNEFRNLN